jgi:hypothetical protein
LGNHCHQAYCYLSVNPYSIQGRPFAQPDFDSALSVWYTNTQVRYIVKYSSLGLYVYRCHVREVTIVQLWTESVHSWPERIAIVLHDGSADHHQTCPHHARSIEMKLHRQPIRIVSERIHHSPYLNTVPGVT